VARLIAGHFGCFAGQFRNLPASAHFREKRTTRRDARIRDKTRLRQRNIESAAGPLGSDARTDTAPRWMERIIRRAASGKASSALRRENAVSHFASPSDRDSFGTCRSRDRRRLNLRILGCALDNRSIISFEFSFHRSFPIRRRHRPAMAQLAVSYRLCADRFARGLASRPESVVRRCIIRRIVPRFSGICFPRAVKRRRKT